MTETLTPEEEKVLNIFNAYHKIFDAYHKEEHTLTNARSEFLKDKILEVFPDFLTNNSLPGCLPVYGTAERLLCIMDKLHNAGYKILEPQNKKYCHWVTVPWLRFNTNINDIFTLWVHPDVETFVKQLEEKWLAESKSKPLYDLIYELDWYTDAEPNNLDTDFSKTIVIIREGGPVWKYCYLCGIAVANNAGVIAVKYEEKSANDAVIVFSLYEEFPIGKTLDEAYRERGKNKPLTKKLAVH